MTDFMKRFLFAVTLLFLSLSNLNAERFVPSSDLIPKVLEMVKRGYVDQGRVQPLRMLEGALERVSATVAPVLTEMKVTGDQVVISVKVDKHQKEIKSKVPKTVRDLNQLLQEVADFIKGHLDRDESLEEVDYALINGFLKKLDPHTTLLVPEVYSDFSTSTSGNFGGVGMMIGLRDGELTVISPIDGTPASRAGLQAKDKVVQIDDESTINMALPDAVKKLRGEAGTEVVIYIMRKGFNEPKRVPIIRDIIKINSVESEVFTKGKDRVGYIQIKTFGKNTDIELDQALEDMDYDLKTFKGLILDLRNNPGGLLSQAIKVSYRFLNAGVIVSTAGLDSDSKQSFEAHWFSTLNEMPLIVLINHGSASASEIVTAALKKNKRALIMGSTSFGKGSVQQVIPLKGGSALKMTTSKYLTPGDISIQSVGVSPHIEVVPYFIDQDFLRVTPQSNDNGEDSLEENFEEWGDRDKAEKPELSAFYLYEDEEKAKAQAKSAENGEDNPDDEEQDDSKKARLERLNKDFLVQSSLEILVKNKSTNFAGLIKEANGYMTAEEKAQEAKMIERFKKFDAPWAQLPAKGKPKLVAKSWVEIEKDKKWVKLDGPVPADSQIRLYLEVENQGGGTTGRLVATTHSKNPVFDDRQLAFGSLAEKKSRVWFLPIRISTSSLTRNDLINFDLTDLSDKVLASHQMALIIQEKPMPRFDYQLRFLDNNDKGAAGNKNGIMEPGETIAVEVTVKNNGVGASGKLSLLFKNGEGERVFLKNGRLTLEPLAPGQGSKALFLFEYRGKPLDGKLDFSFDLLDSTYPLSSISHKLKVPVEEKEYALQNQLPQITIENPVWTSKSRKLTFVGKVSDDSGVKDLYLFNKNKKIYYKNFSELKDRKQVEFEVNLELSDEDNRIILVSRDQANVSGQKTVYIRYEGPK
ncbi:MAG: hypothetical protein A2508_00870 [Candidatus Lambdaproteobacteria bacterium RIFOXYD12_FULL_49_8]|nr:MAG: hypothetical protein A2508_00870 [Candidatus Lambdaproteobacteria bacterium RIFOXYD12_FULL_49_8]